MDEGAGRGARASSRRGRFAGGHALSSAALVLLVAAAPRDGRFAPQLPEGVPALERWTKASGSAEYPDGRWLEYELYFDPTRAYYEVIRYRLSGWDGGEEGPYSANERMQWQAQLKDLRRYECEPQAAGGCLWRELQKDTPEYKRELRVLMWVLDLHRRLLHEREAAAGK